MNNATIKTAPENSGLVKVQLSNVINRSNKSNCWFLLSDMLDPLATSNQIATSKHQIKVCHEQCHYKDCPRELWFGRNAVAKCQTNANCWFLLCDMLDPLATSNQIATSKHQIQVCHEQCHYKDCPRELWFGQGSVIKCHKSIKQKQLLVSPFWHVGSPGHKQPNSNIKTSNTSLPCTIPLRLSRYMENFLHLAWHQQRKLQGTNKYNPFWSTELYFSFVWKIQLQWLEPCFLQSFLILFLCWGSSTIT